MEVVHIYSTAFGVQSKNGNWSKDHLNGAVMVMPFKEGYIFKPQNLTATSSTDNVDFLGLKFPNGHGAGSLKWSLNVGGGVYSNPAIGADGRIYFTSYINKELHAVDPNGKEVWVFKMGGYVSSSPAIGADGTVYVTARDGKLYAVSHDGSLKWTFKTSYGGIVASPAIGSDGTIYFGARDHRLYAINPDGSLKWKFKTSGKISSSPAIGYDGTIYFGSKDGIFYAMNPNGTVKWKISGFKKILSTPSIGKDGVVYIGSYYRTLYAINPDGTKRWTFKTKGYISSSVVISNQGLVYFGTLDDEFYALNSSSLGLMESVWPTFHRDARRTGLALKRISTVYDLSGRVVDDDGEPLENVAISFGKNYAPVTTDENGYWSKPKLKGKIVVTPHFGGYEFSPKSITVDKANDKVNFTASIIVVESISEGFESGKLSNIWITDGNAIPFITTEETHTGRYSLRFGKVKDDQYSQLTVIVYLKKSAVLTYYQKVSSEKGGDGMIFFVDDDTDNGIISSGKNDWERVKTSVPAGVHSLTWMYLKDSDTTEGKDAAWIDDITLK